MKGKRPGEVDQRDRPKMKGVSVRNSNRLELTIHFGLLIEVRDGRDDAVTISLDVLLNGDADFRPDSSHSCEPVGFLKQEANVNQCSARGAVHSRATYSETDALRVV